MKICFRFRHCFDLARLVFLDSVLVAWLFYGNKMFFSTDNDCFEGERETQILAGLMAAVLALGFFTIVVYLLIMCSIPYSMVRYGEIGPLGLELYSEPSNDPPN